MGARPGKYDIATPRPDILARLDERDRQVIGWRAEGLRLDDIAARWGVTRERVRQVQARASRRYYDAAYPTLRRDLCDLFPRERGIDAWIRGGLWRGGIFRRGQLRRLARDDVLALPFVAERASRAMTSRLLQVWQGLQDERR